MPDIQMRFNKDMLVFSSPIKSAFLESDKATCRDNFDPEMLCITEPDTIQEALKWQIVAGAQCLVAPLEDLCESNLIHKDMTKDATHLCDISVKLANQEKPQHTIAQINCCNLPFDNSSENSKKQLSAQYYNAAMLYANKNIDAIMLNNLRSISEIELAILAVKKAVTLPVIVSVEFNNDSTFSNKGISATEVASAMCNSGAQVIGFSSGAPLEVIEKIALDFSSCAHTRNIAVLGQVIVNQNNPKQGSNTTENPYYCSDTMVQVATTLRRCGVQFLRACGQASPAYTGTLVAASAGFDVITRGNCER